jgi:hypothetical protein
MNDLLEVSLLAQRDDVAISVRPITGRRLLAPASFAQHAANPSCDVPSSCEGRDGFTVFHSSNLRMI